MTDDELKRMIVSIHLIKFSCNLLLVPAEYLWFSSMKTRKDYGNILINKAFILFELDIQRISNL
jgi:hypothetical protein